MRSFALDCLELLSREPANHGNFIVAGSIAVIVRCLESWMDELTTQQKGITILAHLSSNAEAVPCPHVRAWCAPTAASEVLPPAARGIIGMVRKVASDPMADGETKQGGGRHGRQRVDSSGGGRGSSGGDEDSAPGETKVSLAAVAKAAKGAKTAKTAKASARPPSPSNDPKPLAIDGPQARVLAEAWAEGRRSEEEAKVLGAETGLGEAIVWRWLSEHVLQDELDKGNTGRSAVRVMALATKMAEPDVVVWFASNVSVDQDDILRMWWEDEGRHVTRITMTYLDDVIGRPGFEGEDITLRRIRIWVAAAQEEDKKRVRAMEETARTLGNVMRLNSQVRVAREGGIERFAAIISKYAVHDHGLPGENESAAAGPAGGGGGAASEAADEALAHPAEYWGLMLAAARALTIVASNESLHASLLRPASEALRAAVVGSVPLLYTTVETAELDSNIPGVLPLSNTLSPPEVGPSGGGTLHRQRGMSVETVLLPRGGASGTDGGDEAPFAVAPPAAEVWALALLFHRAVASTAVDDAIIALNVEAAERLSSDATAAVEGAFRLKDKQDMLVWLRSVKAEGAFESLLGIGICSPLLVREELTVIMVDQIKLPPTVQKRDVVKLSLRQAVAEMATAREKEKIEQVKAGLGPRRVSGPPPPGHHLHKKKEGGGGGGGDPASRRRPLGQRAGPPGGTDEEDGNGGWSGNSSQGGYSDSEEDSDSDGGGRGTETAYGGDTVDDANATSPRRRALERWVDVLREETAAIQRMVWKDMSAVGVTLDSWRGASSSSPAQRETEKVWELEKLSTAIAKAYEDAEDKAKTEFLSRVCVMYGINWGPLGDRPYACKRYEIFPLLARRVRPDLCPQKRWAAKSSNKGKPGKAGKDGAPGKEMGAGEDGGMGGGEEEEEEEEEESAATIREKKEAKKRQEKAEKSINAAAGSWGVAGGKSMHEDTTADSVLTGLKGYLGRYGRRGHNLPEIDTRSRNMGTTLWKQAAAEKAKALPAGVVYVKGRQNTLGDDWHVHGHE
jgi:hypothetical protein